MKRCRRCSETKPESSFHAKPTNRDGLQSHCKLCQYQSVVDRLAKRKARREADLGPATACAICGCKGELVWDHNHETGDGRGWLCPNCNTGLGMLGDNPRLLVKAAEYLRQRTFSASRSLVR